MTMSYVLPFHLAKLKVRDNFSVEKTFIILAQHSLFGVINKKQSIINQCGIATKWLAIVRVQEQREDGGCMC